MSVRKGAAVDGSSTTPQGRSPVRVELGDCIEVMAAMPTQSVDAIVTDPPYGLSFMGSAWDTFDPATLPARVGRRDGNGPPSDVRDGRTKGRSKSAFANGVAGEAGAYDFSARGNRGFQGWCEQWAREALRVLKPGGHLLAFGGTRTYHRLTCGIEDAGFEIRDTLCWLYGSGFPKSLDVSKAIDKAAGGEREVVGSKLDRPGYSLAEGPANAIYGQGIGGSGDPEAEAAITAPATLDAGRWQGWGTALKPAHEPIVVARKPLAGTVAGNVLAHGTGALNVEGCRVGFASDADEAESKTKNRHADFGSGARENAVYGRDVRARADYDSPGRWPANVVMDEAAAAMLDAQTDGRIHGAGHARDDRGGGTYDGSTGIGFAADGRGIGAGRVGFRLGDDGGASRFFYVAKADSGERHAGLAGSKAGVSLLSPEDVPDRNDHPTVKPIALMRWLVRLVTPPGGTVLDPFAGSGTTGCAAALEGLHFIGIERDPAYARIARARLAHWSLGEVA